ncbi:MAG: transcription termination factor Rho [Patescibacteria group bacterium]
MLATPKEETPPQALSIDEVVGAPQEGKAASEPVAPKAADLKATTPVLLPEKPETAGQTTPPQRGEPAPATVARPLRFHGGFRRNFQRDFVATEGNGNGFTLDINVPTETVRGILDIMPEGHGFLRPKFTPSERDVYISQSQIRRFLLRNGDMVEGRARPPKDNERYWGLLKVEKVNDQPAEGMERRPKFEDLVPVYPNKHLKLETGQLPLSTRIIDLVAPIGFGQRGLIVSPPKAGKTTILKEIAAGVAANYPEVHLMAALIGERPEEVTDISRSVHGEVLASNFDESPEQQTRIAEVALDRAKRLVEQGKDVVILLDSITRLARAYNLVVNPSGRTLSGGFDPAALYPAKRFLGAARCVEGGGSMTVIGTALIDTGSRMDDLIYEEFKGTGNMELTLSRSLQERRIFPALDIGKSGTRHDELLLGEEMMKKVTTLRHMLSLLSEEERTMMLIERLTKTKSNQEFLDSLAKG